MDSIELRFSDKETECDECPAHIRPWDPWGACEGSPVCIKCARKKWREENEYYLTLGSDPLGEEL